MESTRNCIRSLLRIGKFWGSFAEDWTGKRNGTSVEWDFSKPKFKWFVGGKLNAINCLDRHLNTWRRNKCADLAGEPLEENRSFTYQQLYYHVCKFANVLKKLG